MERLTEKIGNTNCVKGCGSNCKYGFQHCRTEDWENCKAIDDLIAECKNAKFAESDEISLSDVHTGVNSGLSMAIHFAEQLKVGGENV